MRPINNEEYNTELGSLVTEQLDSGEELGDQAWHNVAVKMTRRFTRYPLTIRGLKKDYQNVSFTSFSLWGARYWHQISSVSKKLPWWRSEPLMTTHNSQIIQRHHTPVHHQSAMERKRCFGPKRSCVSAMVKHRQVINTFTNLAQLLQWTATILTTVRSLNTSVLGSLNITLYELTTAKVGRSVEDNADKILRFTKDVGTGPRM